MDRVNRGRTAMGRTAWVLGAALVSAAPPSALAQAVAWFDKAWPVRRVVTVESQRTVGADGDEIGVVELPTDALARPGGADIRVADANGVPVRMWVLQVGPGSTARVAFAVRPGRGSYAIYYGHARPPPLPAELELTVRRGLMVETATFAGGGIANYAGTLAAYQRASAAPGGMQGRDFVDRVFVAHNLFGPAGRTISRYTGFLRVPADGDYGFATSSVDASFLLIGGQVVVEWPGRHGWVADARHNKTIALTAGVHAFEYLHANVSARGGAVAAWKPPGADRWLPIPASAFLPVFRGTLGARERFGTTQSAEMTWRNVGEALIGTDDYIQRYRFVSRPTGFDAAAAEFHWDFGDGTSAAGVGLAEIEHVYLTDGPVQATVTVRRGAQSDTVSNRVTISRNWPLLVNIKPDPPAAHARIVRGYDFAKMAPRAVGRAMELLKRTNQADAYMAAGHALATACEPVSDAVLVERMGEYAEFLMARNPRDGPPAAVAEYVEAARRATSPFARAEMFVGAGRILLDRLDNDPRAEQLFAAALKFKDRGGDRSIKAAWIGMGDVHRRRGDGDKALDAYRSAERIEPGPAPNQAAVEVGSLARSIEYYLREKDYETAARHLADWDWQFPTQRLHGYSTLLWVRYYQARDMHREAVREASDLIASAPRSNYAPELLLLSADSWLALKDPARARRLLENVVALYPDSPLVADAKKKLGEPGN